MEACINIGICEDDAPVAQDLSDRAAAFLAARGYACKPAVFSDAASFLAAGQEFALVFLDCRLPDQNGLDVARLLSGKRNKPIIVFISAYEEYVFESFEVGTFRYLLKPIGDDVLRKTLESFLSYYENNLVIDIPTKEKTFFVKRNDIIYIESAQKHSIVRVAETEYLPDTNYEAIRSLSEYTALIDAPSFFRTHKRFFVNMAYIEKIENRVITLSIGERVEISRRKSAAFNEAYNRYLRTSV